MKGRVAPDLSTRLFGTDYAAPFGIGPIGLAGMIWPNAEQILARTAARCRIPFLLSTVATRTPEDIGPEAGGMGWFQLYPPRNRDIRRSLLARARESGFTTLVITADVPISSRRERQARAGIGYPLVVTPLMILRCLARPAWAFATLVAGFPRLKSIEPYIGAGEDDPERFFHEQLSWSLDWDYLKEVRKEWHGPIVLKGILDARDAVRAVDIGLDGIVVSNHGGRQFDAAPASISVLPDIVEAVGGRAKVLFDSGVRDGLDIIRALALGADFVLLGRAFMYGVAALGRTGGDHVAELLRVDMEVNMAQLGCRNLNELPDRLSQPQ